MNRRIVVSVIFLAIAIGVTAVVWMRRKQPLETTQEPLKVRVVVAARDLPPRKILTSGDVTTAEISADKMPQGALMRVEEAVGSILLRSTMKGEVISQGSLQQTPEKLRKFSVPMGLRGFVLYQHFMEGAADVVLPGDWVDVIATKQIEVERGAGTATLAEVIVRRAQVLVAEDYSPELSREERLRQQVLTKAEKMTPPPPEPQGQPSGAAKPVVEPPRPQVNVIRLILAVTAEEAVRMARALEEGRVLTVLRNERDIYPIPPLRSPEFRPQPVSRSVAPSVEIARPSTISAPVHPAQTVVIYRGSQREEMLVGR